MTNRDLAKIDEFIERYNKLPKTAELKIKTLFGESSEEEKQEALEIIDEIDNIFAEIWAFVKVKYGKESGYLKRCHEIDFTAKVMGIPVVTTDRNMIESSWRKGMRDFNHLLRDLRLETLTIIEHEKSSSAVDKKAMEPDFKSLKILVGKGKLEEAITFLHDKIDDNKHLNYLILQSARYYDIERAINMNTVQWDNANVEKNKIRASVLDLIDELEANEKEDQKYVTKEDEIEMGINVMPQEKHETDIIPSISTVDWEAEGLILRFLKVFNQWYFSPLRINKWGSRQNGFQELSNYSSKKIKSILERLLKEGKVKRTSSKKGNPIYKIIE